MPRPPRRSFWPAIVLSLAGHALLLALILLLAPPEEAGGPESVAVFTTSELPAGLKGPARGAGSTGGGPASARRRHSGEAAGTPAEPQAAAGAPGGGGPTILEMIDEHFRKETFVPPAGGGAEGPKAARRDGPYGHETDSIDGVPTLGSGEPGDPRIPGSGGVDIAKVLARDAVVAQAQCRAADGRIHPFLKEAKDRIEDHWLPVGEDVSAIPGERGRSIVPDTGCPHVRYRVGRVLAVYDAKGRQLSLTVVDAPRDRNLSARLQAAVEQAGMPPPPPDLLDDRGVLTLAWNVYVDDYRNASCWQIGQGASHKKPGGDNVIGIVELDGVY